ncbi:hypothetical protein ACVK00_001847 [Burkholderia sp. PvR073]
MKRGAVVGRSSCATTGSPARATRGSRETGSDEPARLALHRESYYTLSDYPKGAQGMRESSCCLWSSSLFPRLLIDELTAPHLRCIWSTARRCNPYRKRHAMRDSTDGCASHAVRCARICRRESHFLFQECIAVTVGSLRRSLNAAQQGWKRRTNAARGASCRGRRTGVSTLRSAPSNIPAEGRFGPCKPPAAARSTAFPCAKNHESKRASHGSAGPSRRTSVRLPMCAPATAQRD